MITFEEAVKQLKKSTSKEQCLRKAYDIMSKKYRGYRVKTYTRIWRLFRWNIDILWKRQGFLHCNQMNYLLKELLVQSGLFTNEDIIFKWTTVWFFSPHQYVKVRIDKETSVNIDLWGKAYGITFGDYAHGFH